MNLLSSTQLVLASSTVVQKLKTMAPMQLAMLTSTPPTMQFGGGNTLFQEYVEHTIARKHALALA